MRHLKWITVILAAAMFLACGSSSLPTSGCQENSECEDDQICADAVCVQPPQLVVNSPLNFGESPIGIRERGRLVLTNSGDLTLTISDFEVEPDEGIFYIAINELPIEIKRKQSKELTIYFRPQEINNYKSALSFDSNHSGSELIPVDLIGKGISNIICLPCTPPPESECHEDQMSSITYLLTNNTSCDGAEGICAYQMVETECEEECDPLTGLCPNIAPPTSDWDAGTPPPPPVDAGPPPGACSENILQGDACDDGDACTENDLCQDGECHGSPLCTELPSDECLDETVLRHYLDITGCTEGVCQYNSEDLVCEFGCHNHVCTIERSLSNFTLETSLGIISGNNKTLRGRWVPSPYPTLTSGNKTLRIRAITSEKINASIP
jgi:hypothetical protein